MKRAELGVNHGGLYRCCLNSAALWVEEDPEAEAKEGEKIPCLSEEGEPLRMVVKDGKIRWNNS